jgi:23S rRNA pseudouridine1911/1915/1917 synthase
MPEQTDHSHETIPIIYLDKEVIVIDKPAGILTHAKGAVSDEFTVADFFRRYTTVGLDTNRPGIIHRLDRDTSGILIGARTDGAAKLLAKQFADRKTKKTYLAVVSGHLKQKEATIELPIDRHPSAPSTFRVDPKGKLAITHYTVLAENEHESLVELRPVTGRTHQLRVHMAYLNTPIKGDRVYGREADRLYLHALKLEITIPVSDRRIFEAPLPEGFTAGFKTNL